MQYFMPRHNPEISAFIPPIQVPLVLKEDFVLMCHELGYQQAELIRELLRERVGVWKEKKQAA